MPLLKCILTFSESPDLLIAAAHQSKSLHSSEAAKIEVLGVQTLARNSSSASCAPW